MNEKWKGRKVVKPHAERGGTQIPSVMQPVRIAAVRYLNTAPLVEGLGRVEGLTLVPTVPSRIGEMVRGGQADIGLASIVDAAVDAAEDGAGLTLLPVGMIGCDGPTLTVRLFSAEPFDRVSEVFADTDSHTSVILAQVLLRHLHGTTPRVRAFDARERVAVGAGSADTQSLDEAWPRTLLLIGDKVVTDCPPAVRYPHQMDLGAAWKEWTGLPFVYATWMCRAADLQEEVSRERIMTGAALLDRQRRHNATRLDWIVETRAPAARWPMDLAREYVGHNLRYEVGEREREAVARFMGLAREAGLVGAGEVRWAGA